MPVSSADTDIAAGRKRFMNSPANNIPMMNLFGFGPTALRIKSAMRRASPLFSTAATMKNAQMNRASVFVLKPFMLILNASAALMPDSRGIMSVHSPIWMKNVAAAGTA